MKHESAKLWADLHHLAIFTVKGRQQALICTKDPYNFCSYSLNEFVAKYSKLIEQDVLKDLEIEAHMWFPSNPSDLDEWRKRLALKIGYMVLEKQGKMRDL